MTHTSTEQERGFFEAVASDNGKWLKAIERDAKGNYLLLTTAVGWMWWQAARQAPVVPQRWKITEEMHVAAVKVLHRASGVDDLPQRMVDAMLAAAPQPPETTPVELQEPVGWFHRHPKECKNGEVCNYQIALADKKDGWEESPLYTEQQVHALLTGVPTPAAYADTKDAARYRWLRDNDWRNDEKMEPVIRLQLNAIWDEKIDAAMAAQAKQGEPKQ